MSFSSMNMSFFKYEYLLNQIFPVQQPVFIVLVIEFLMMEFKFTPGQVAFLRHRLDKPNPVSHIESGLTGRPKGTS